MKAFVKVLVLTVLASVPGLAGCAPENTRTQIVEQEDTSVSAVTLVPPPEDLPFPAETYQVKLPKLATLELRQGGSRSGQVTEIKAGRLTLMMSGEPFTARILDIKKVTFRDENPRLINTPAPVGQSLEIWRVKPLSAFELEKPNKAQIQRKAVFKELAPKQEFSGNASSYAVQEMSFIESPDKSITMTMKLTAVD